MLTIFAENISPRLDYISAVIFQDILGLDLRLTADLDVLNAADSGINYSHLEVDDVPYIRPHQLLFAR